MPHSVIITGATGLVGSEVVRAAIADSTITKITVIVRRQLPQQHPKVHTIIRKDFKDYSGLEETFATHEACIWCLGISQNLVSREEYHNITYNYTVAAAKAVLHVNPAMRFVFVSGTGADSNEKSRVLFARVKGMAENALRKLPFQKLVIARPGGIIPTHPKPGAKPAEKMIVVLSKIVGFFMPRLVIRSGELARALLHLAKHGANKIIVENQELKKLAG